MFLKLCKYWKLQTNSSSILVRAGAIAMLCSELCTSRLLWLSLIVFSFYWWPIFFFLEKADKILVCLHAPHVLTFLPCLCRFHLVLCFCSLHERHTLGLILPSKSFVRTGDDEAVCLSSRAPTLTLDLWVPGRSRRSNHNTTQLSPIHPTEHYTTSCSLQIS